MKAPSSALPKIFIKVENTHKPFNEILLYVHRAKSLVSGRRAFTKAKCLWGCVTSSLQEQRVVVVFKALHMTSIIIIKHTLYAT